ncbi:IMPACT family protein [Niabella ginsengisoli]|uniref:YigZ family protein n=1 Tax=Niabella ginsengisoli TaxID=522298 RepID=A0ABS9SID8_9BACT|nr:YigZ family protein [Niabella ginsengisoli]MCH5597919.1 YigZ family protein [Niabella ginsengisoli]
MQLPDYFNTINSTGTAEFKDKGSRFVAIAVPVKTIADCKQRIAEVKKQYPKASHYCFAYRLGLDNNQFRVSDDGEPSGSAGRPILGQIDSRGATDILIVVVRYFGGTLLGVPGLINAYKSAAAMVLQVMPLIRKPVLIPYQLQFDYTQMNDIMIAVKQFDCEILKQDIQLFCAMDIGIPQYRLDETLMKLGDARDISIKAIKK